MISSLALVACIQAVSVLAIKQMRLLQSQYSKQLQVTTAYGNEAEHKRTQLQEMRTVEETLLKLTLHRGNDGRQLKRRKRDILY